MKFARLACEFRRFACHFKNPARGLARLALEFQLPARVAVVVACGPAFFASGFACSANEFAQPAKIPAGLAKDIIRFDLLRIVHNFST
jgi:hypothetical protein